MSISERTGPIPSEPGSKVFTPQAAARVAIATLRLELGNMSNVKWIGDRGVSHQLGPGYRIYFGKDGDALIILLGGGTNQRQKADIERAKDMWTEYRARKAAAAKPKGKR